MKGEQNIIYSIRSNCLAFRNQHFFFRILQNHPQDAGWEVKEDGGGWKVESEKKR
jgi:hypothetical protein